MFNGNAAFLLVALLVALDLGLGVSVPWFLVAVAVALWWTIAEAILSLRRERQAEKLRDYICGLIMERNAARDDHVRDRRDLEARWDTYR